jgi:hypothetical protein
MLLQRLALPLTLLNSVLLVVLLLAAMAPTNPTDKVAPSVVRAQAIELVDAEGNVRGQLYLGADGGGNLRLRAPNGEVRVKLGATNDGSGLLLLDQTTEPALLLAAKAADTKLTLKSKDRQPKILQP